MGRKKTSSKATAKKTAGRKQASKVPAKTLGNDMLGGFLTVFGLILTVFYTFSNIGAFPKFINDISKGLFGYLAYILPITLVIVGIYSIASENRVRILREVKKGLIVMTLMSALVYSFVCSNFNMFSNFVKYFVDSYNFGIDGANPAGLVGSVISAISVAFIGLLATQIVITFLAIVALLYSFNVSFKEFFMYVRNVISYIAQMFKRVFGTLFRTNGDNIEDEDLVDEKPLTRKQRLANKKKEAEDLAKMKEKGNKNVEENLRLDNTEQVEFDFNKLGGKVSEDQMQKKQQRDDYFRKQKEEKEDKGIKEVLTIGHTNHAQNDNYVFPEIDLLGEKKVAEVFDKKGIHATAVKLQKTLASFGVEAKVTNITKGPTVTRYELTPSVGVRVNKIVNLTDDIALSLAAKSIRIEAPIPGKAAVGIEVPNPIAESVFLREVIESNVFKENESKVSFSLGKDASGDIIIGDIAKMPHVLVAGSTGSGKSVCINSLIVSFLYKAKPSEVKLILIDPKMVELSGYNGIPHLLIPVVTDPKKAAGALNWAVQEMVNRYNLFASKNVKDIKGYNKIIEKEEGIKLPQIVIIIDELADLMMVAPNDVEDAICRLAQMARAAGMHLVIATQRPSVDVITGIIKANIPSRIAFTVSSQIDSRTILDSAGAEKLLGKGDMLYFPVGVSKPQRIQGTFISEVEIEKIVNSIKENTEVTYSEEIIESIEKVTLKSDKSKPKETDNANDNDKDDILDDAIDLVVDLGQASASMLQRKFKIGYSRAGRIIDQMEERGLISGYDGSKPRQVLISRNEWHELKFGNENNQEIDVKSESEENKSEEV